MMEKRHPVKHFAENALKIPLHGMAQAVENHSGTFAKSMKLLPTKAFSRAYTIALLNACWYIAI